MCRFLNYEKVYVSKGGTLLLSYVLSIPFKCVHSLKDF